MEGSKNKREGDYNFFIEYVILREENFKMDRGGVWDYCFLFFCFVRELR